MLGMMTITQVMVVIKVTKEIEETAKELVIRKVIPKATTVMTVPLQTKTQQT